LVISADSEKVLRMIGTAAKAVKKPHAVNYRFTRMGAGFCRIQIPYSVKFTAPVAVSQICFSFPVHAAGVFFSRADHLHQFTGKIFARLSSLEVIRHIHMIRWEPSVLI